MIVRLRLKKRLDPPGPSTEGQAHPHTLTLAHQSHLPKSGTGTVAFRIKTNNVHRYAVAPDRGELRAGASENIDIRMVTRDKT